MRIERLFRLRLQDPSSGSSAACFQLQLGENHIGSMSSNQVVLTESGVSRQHALLDVGPLSCTLRDLASKNGTFVNGRRIRSAVVRPGDDIEFGQIKVRLEEIDPEDGEIGLQLSDVARRDPSLPRHETTQVIRKHPEGSMVSRLSFLENFTERLCLLPRADLAGALRLLVSELRVPGAAIMELLENGEAVMMASGGSIPDHSLDTGMTAFRAGVQHARQQASPGVICTSFRTGEEPPVLGSLLVAEGAEPMGLLVAGEVESQQEVEALLRTLVRLLDRFRPRPVSLSEDESLDDNSGLVFPSGYVRGHSAAMVSLYDQMRPLVQGDLPVLIIGDTGVGKEYVARILHSSSPRAKGPFVAINCAAIPTDLLESELFGVARGAATGVKERAGRFQQAQGGTIFLDEIGDMMPELQGKLLRALQEGEVQVVGGRLDPVDVRVVSATNANLFDRMEAGHFRADLYYRLAGYVLNVPPLRERREDIPALVENFLRRFAGEVGKHLRGVTVKALRSLLDYPWPGNVRELEHEIRRLAYLCRDGQPIDSGMLSRNILKHSAEASAQASEERAPLLDQENLDLATMERSLIEEALDRAEGVLVQAAKLLGISRDALRRRIQRYNIDTADD